MTSVGYAQSSANLSEFDRFLNEYRRSTELSNQVAFDATEICRKYQGDHEDKSVATVFEMHFVKDGERLSISSRALNVGTTQPSYTSKTVDAGGSNVSVQYPLDDSKRIGVVRYTSQEESRDRLLWQLMCGRVLHGSFSTDGRHQTIFQIMSEGSEKTVEHHNGLTMLRSKSASGTHTLWLDPSKPQPCVWVEVYKTGADLLWGKSLPRNLHSYRTIARNIGSIAIDGVSVPYTVRVQEISTFENGEVVTIESDHLRTNVTVAPSVSNSNFSIDIPDGTPVFQKPVSAIAYEWRGGKPQPAVDAEALALINKDVELAKPTFEEVNANPKVVPAADSHAWSIAWISAALLALIASILVYFARIRNKVA